MLQRRTDLAMEAEALWRESAETTSRLSGVRAEEVNREGYTLTRVDILDQEGAKSLGKPIGTYRTLDLSPYFHDRSGQFSTAAELLAGELSALLPEEGGIFVAGLGNRAMTPDAIGPLAVEHLLITRHLQEVLPDFRPVSAAAAGVLGTTGLESAEWVRGLSERAEPSAIIVVDALASRSVERLCSTVQLSDTGIIPGSGVGNTRVALNRETLGIPVISIGVPTVVDSFTLVLDLLPEATAGDIPSALRSRGASLFVTSRDIDEQMRQLSKLIGYSINLALQPGLTVEDVAALLG